MNWRLTVVETFVPIIFIICFSLLLLIGIYLLATSGGATP